jgi:hypothetical protein
MRASVAAMEVTKEVSNVGRRCQILGDHPKKSGRGPQMGKVLEQPFLPILPKKEVRAPFTYF